MSTTYGISDSWVNLSKVNSQAGLIASQLHYAVDFNRTLSYPGSGITLNDLQGSIVGTFNNGPAFNSSGNVKFLELDGSNDYISITDFTLPTVCSVYFSIRTTAAGERG